MTTRLVLLCLSAALLAGCNEPPAPAPVKHHTRPQRGDTRAEKVDKALLQGSPDALDADRLLLRDWRRGGEKDKDKWPACQAVAKAFEGVADLQTLAGVQDALVAAQVDDYVLCDKPAIFAATKLAAETAAMRLAPDLTPQETVSYLISHPRGRKMGDCWMMSLRQSRQNELRYTKAFDLALGTCSK